jgi:AraC family ethanolamine operon transcriptional activator
MIGHGDLEHAQLDPGKFSGTLSQLIHGPVIIGSHRMNRTILQHGVGIDGCTNFIIPGNMEQKISWRGHVLSGNHIGILKSGMEHKSVTVSNFFGTPVSISNEYLEEVSVLLGFPEFMDLVRRSEVIVINKNDTIKIQEMIIGLCSAKIFNESMFTYELPKLIIQSISKITKPDQKGFHNSPNMIFRKAQDFIQGNIHGKINILDLSKEIGISERNLRYVFTNKIGIGPKKYIYNLKLNKVRKELKIKRDEKVNILANNYGLWHAGKFASDYKRLFGELPSKTKRLTNQ